MKKSMTLNLSLLTKEQIINIFKVLLINNECVDNETASELQRGEYDNESPFLRWYKYGDNNYEWLVIPEIKDGFLINYENFILFFKKQL